MSEKDMDLLGSPILSNQVINISKHANTTTANKNLSRAQKSFNRLSNKVATQRRALQEWLEFEPVIHKKQTTELLPTFDRLSQMQLEFAEYIDGIWSNQKFTKRDKKIMSQFIADIVMSVVDVNRNVDKEKAQTLLSRHSNINLEQEQALEQEGFKSIIEGIFGETIDADIDFTDEESMLKWMKNFAEEQQNQHEQQELIKPRKKTAKQLAKEAKLEQAEKEISQSIRAVYRQLSSALHPDRAANEEERAVRTEKMKQVNVAYEKQDILALLTLQLEVEQIDQDHLDGLSEEKISHFSQILKQQSEELAAELEGRKLAFSMRSQISAQVLDYPTRKILTLLNDELKEMQLMCTQLEQDLIKYQDLNVFKLEVLS